jgi:hypothetical protein
MLTSLITFIADPLPKEAVGTAIGGGEPVIAALNER